MTATAKTKEKMKEMTMKKAMKKKKTMAKERKRMMNEQLNCVVCCLLETNALINQINSVAGCLL